MQQKSVSAVIVAAGRSQRMGFDKLAYLIDGKTVLQKTFEAFDEHPLVDEIVLVYGNNKEEAEKLISSNGKRIICVAGGDTRAQSVKNGVLSSNCRFLAIHDAARPFVSPNLITLTLQAAFTHKAAAPAVPVKDTIKKAKDGIVVETPKRSELFAVQTPQCFERDLYISLLNDKADDYTDDCQLFEKNGYSVFLTEGDYENFKITTKEDIIKTMQFRIGHGYDVHRLVENRKLIIGGVDIPFEKGLLGHSDADVLLHAIMDAMLGALGMGDIGKLFPDNDQTYLGADSIQLLKKVSEIITGNGWHVNNIDSTILCQKPKLAPYILQMRSNIADALGISVEIISVKATTEEKLGFTGSGEGIAAHAVVLLNK